MNLLNIPVGAKLAKKLKPLLQKLTTRYLTLEKRRSRIVKTGKQDALKEHDHLTDRIVYYMAGIIVSRFLINPTVAIEAPIRYIAMQSLIKDRRTQAAVASALLNLYEFGILPQFKRRGLGDELEAGDVFPSIKLDLKKPTSMKRFKLIVLYDYDQESEAGLVLMHVDLQQAHRHVTGVKT